MKKSSIIILVIILSVGILFTVVVKLAKISKRVEQKNIPSISIPTDWKTYTNKIIGLEFKYPADWPTLVPDDSGDTKQSSFFLSLPNFAYIAHTYMNYDNMPIDQQHENIKCEKLYALKCEDKINLNGSKYTWFLENTKGGPEYEAMIATGKYILIFNFRGETNYLKNADQYEKLLSSLKIIE